MKKVLTKSNLVAGILILVVVCLGIVFAADVIVKQGTLEAENLDATATVEGEVFKSTGCTATGTKAVAFGGSSTATGTNAVAFGSSSTASGYCSTAMGYCATASGSYGSTAIGATVTAGDAGCTTAIGSAFTNNVQDSFAVGFGQKDFSIVSGTVTVGDVPTDYGDLYVGGTVYANAYGFCSSFYDKDSYGRALDYSEDSSRTIRLNAEGEKEYNHEADPEFVQRWITLKDYDTYTEEEVWDEVLNKTITRRIYETHQELGGDLGMMVAWLRQCVFELRQENQMLKAELAKLKEAVGVE